MHKNIGLFFGSFNPIHIGHVIMGNHITEHHEIDEVWYVITPHNPHKHKKTLLEDHHRYELVYIATENYPKLKPSKIEFGMKQPNYTAITLEKLKETFAEFTFTLIIGEDNLASFKKWKNYMYILEYHQLLVCPRIHNRKIPAEFKKHPQITYTNTPIIEISASFIRNSIQNQKNIKPLLPEKVWTYIDEMNFYKK